MTKKILMTGAGGFIGKNLKPYLENKGFQVFAAASKDYDFTDRAAVLKLIEIVNPDILLLAGFYGINDPKNIPPDIEETNLRIFNNFINAAGGKPVFTFGSGAEYDKSHPIIKAKEINADFIIPADNYGKAKKLVSQEIKKYPNAYNFRLFGVYGPHEFDSRFITYAIKQSLKYEPIVIRQNVIFDYLYINDLCKIMLHFINKPPQERFINLTPAESINLMQISNIINTISANPVPVKVIKEGLANEYTGDSTLLQKELPDFYFTPYVKGIKLFYNYLKQEYAE